MRPVESVEKIYDDLVNRGRLGEEDRRNRFGCLLAGTNDTGFGELDIVVEAVIENADIKRKVFTELEAVMAEDAVIASNTSTLSITEMAADLRRPDRFIGMHFFNPVNRMLLVEVIPGEQTSQQVTASPFEWSAFFRSFSGASGAQFFKTGGQRLVSGTPAPADCSLYQVDRDALFSYLGP